MNNIVKLIVGIIVIVNSSVFALSYDAGSFRQGAPFSFYLTVGQPYQLTTMQARQIILQPAALSLSLLNFGDISAPYTLLNVMPAPSFNQYEFGSIGCIITNVTFATSEIPNFTLTAAPPSTGVMYFVIPEPATVLLLTLGGLLLRKK